MARKTTKKEQKRQSVGAGIMLTVLIGFAAFALYQGISADDEKTKVVVIDEERMEESEKEIRELNTNTNEESAAEKTDSASNTNTEDTDDELAIGGPDGGDESEDVSIVENGETYTNSTHSFSFLVPSGWASNEMSTERIGLIPAGSDISVQYEGDIVVNVKQNPNKLSVKEFYNGKNDVALFTDALGGTEPLTIHGYDAFFFKEVEGYVPSNVVIINRGNTLVEITDTGMRHSDDGIFDAIIQSVK